MQRGQPHAHHLLPLVRRPVGPQAEIGTREELSPARPGTGQPRPRLLAQLAIPHVPCTTHRAPHSAHHARTYYSVSVAAGTAISLAWPRTAGWLDAASSVSHQAAQLRSTRRGAVQGRPVAQVGRRQKETARQHPPTGLLPPPPPSASTMLRCRVFTLALQVQEQESEQYTSVA